MSIQPKIYLQGSSSVSELIHLVFDDPENENIGIAKVCIFFSEQCTKVWSQMDPCTSCSAENTSF